ncbi:MAG: MCP four helix bundle domain-containing protein [Deltaproteobacteria bacterium]|nr:MCP four helix bundle domain-containing protein [Deltaproteobacteria bacterium]
MNIHHLKVKFYIGFLALLFMIGIGTYVNYGSLKEVHGFLEEMYGEHYISSLLAANQKARLANVRAQLVAMTNETDKEKQDKYHAKIKDISNEIDYEFTKWFEMQVKVRDEKMNALIRGIQTVWNEFKTTRDTQLIPLIYQGKVPEAKALAMGIQAERYGRMMSLSDELVKMEEKEARDLITISASSFQKLITITITIAFLTLIVYLAVSYYFMRKDFSFPLAKLSENARLMVEGDISKDMEIKAKSEIGDYSRVMDKAVRGMKNIILKTKGLSVNVEAAVKRIGDSVSSIKRGSEDQAIAMTDVSSSIEELHKIAQDVTKGMEQLLKLSEETSSSILEMAASIEEVDGNVADLTVSVGDTSTSIEEIASTLKEVASGIDNISKGVDETASSLVQIDASAKEIESHARQSVELSNEVAREGERGVKSVELTHAGMEKIKESVNSLAMVIDELGRRSKEIGKIVNVIDDVAMETNLLALNATILAAQAGEHGKGFNVVADEIRELSERTAASTREITGIVSGIQGEIERAASSVEEGMAKVVEGEKLSTETTLVLKGITGRFKAFQDMSLEISKATQEQASGSKQVTQNIETITNTIHQMARATQEQSQGAGQIVKAVEKMRELVSQIKKATAEQTGGSKVIASNTENVMKAIQEINAVSFRQEGESQRISAAVIETTTGATKGMENARMLEEMVFMLKKEMDNLKHGLERFKLDHISMVMVELNTINEVRALLRAMIEEADKQKRDVYAHAIKDLTGRIDGNLAELLASSKDEKIVATVKEIKSIWDEFKYTRDTQIIPFIYEDKIKEAKELALGIQAERYKKMAALLNMDL